MQKNLTQKDSILKWVQIEKERVPIHPSDKESPVPRSFIFKDFTIYFMCYLIPPLTLVLNKFADYPLEFYNHPVPKYIFNKVKQRLKTGESKEVDLDIQNHFCTLIWTGLSTFVLFFTMFVTYYTNMHLFENRFFMIQKLGTPVIYLLRCFANSYIAASNEPLYDFNYLSNFPVFMADEMDKEEENNLTGLINTRASSRYTALEFYSYVTSQINYDPKLSFRTGYHLTGLSVFISLIPLILSLTMRQTSSSGFESFLVFANFLISFPISVVLLRGFMHSFSLYQSMKRTMERLINSTYSEKFIAEKTIAQNPSSDEEKVVLNLTHPDNLRAYFYTHGALTKRENSLESRLISLTASLIAVMSILMLSIISLNFFFGNQGSTNKIMQFAENNSGEIAKRMVGDILNLKDVDLMIMGYLVFVLVLTMIFIASLGSGYNFAAKNAQSQYLYEVYLSATLELQCDGWNEKRMSKQRKGQLETVIKLVEAMTKHFENHVNDLGILGFSYSSLYWYIFAFFSANAIGIIRRQISL